jgi:hypothetical protein
VVGVGGIRKPARFGVRGHTLHNDVGDRTILAVSAQGALAVRLGRVIGGWLILLVGAGCVIAATVLGSRAYEQGTEVFAYNHARPCPAAARSTADCLRAVDGTVSAVTEEPGGYRIPAVYALDVRTPSVTLHLTFRSDSPMLGYAVDGSPVVVTMWRGVPVAVKSGGRAETTTAEPELALAGDLSGSEQAGGFGVILVFLGALVIRHDRSAGRKQLPTHPALAAVMLALLLGGCVIGFAGIALGGNPSRTSPDLVAMGASLGAVLALSVWLGISARRRARTATANFALAHGMSTDARGLPAVTVPQPPPKTHEITSLPARNSPARPAHLARLLAARAGLYVPMLLTVAVLFGIFFTSNDGPAARAFRHAPACIGETNLANCTGDFTAVINGVRTPTNGASFAEVSYATYDGAINAWATFDGDAAMIARQADADKVARTPLTIKVWRQSIIGAQLGGSWHWAENDPPGNTIPTIFLAVSFALLLLVVRVRIRRRVSPAADRQLLLADDLGQLTVAAGSVVLLAAGYWPGALLALAVLVWLGWSARRSARPTLARI